MAKDQSPGGAAGPRFEPEGGRRVARVNVGIEWGLLATLAGATLAFGGVTPLGYSSAEVAIFLLLSVALTAQIRRGKIEIPFPIVLLPFLLLVVLQLVPLPRLVVGWLSPARLLVGPTGGGSRALTLSIYPHETLKSFVGLLAYCAAFVLGALVFDAQKRKSTLVRGLVLLGGFEAVYGTVQYLTGFQKIFTYTKKYYTEDATGTYINRNHFAGLLEMIIPLALAQTFSQLRGGGEPERHDDLGRPRRPGGSVSAKTLLPAFGAVVMLVGLVFSRSRMGILSTLVAVVLVAVVAEFRVGQRAWARVTLLVLGCMVGYAAWIGVDPVLRRYEAFKSANYLEREGRLPLWRDETRLIRDYPVFGSGLGTFLIAFRRYQDTEVGGLIEHAHNDYLEFASETGVAGGLCLWVPIFYLWGKMVLACRRDLGAYRRSILLGSSGSICALLVHSVTDFNLQIPANALIFAVILGIGYKAARLCKSGQSAGAGPALAQRFP